jgi:hypothetical protein
MVLWARRCLVAAFKSYRELDAAGQECELLPRDHRADGNIMLEWSQTANLVN